MKVIGSLGTTIVVATVLTGLATINAAAREKKFEFPMTRGAKPSRPVVWLTLPRGSASSPAAPWRSWTSTSRGCRPNTDFDFFVIQKPGAPFGLAWYQGDIETDDNGEGHGRFIGRLNEETFIVAQAPAVPAPVVHNNAFPDASINPVTNPVHTFHLGLWFNSSADAVNAGCPGDVTPFNGEHNAGIQVLNTSNFPDLQGPLFSVKP